MSNMLPTTPSDFESASLLASPGRAAPLLSAARHIAFVVFGAALIVVTGWVGGWRACLSLLPGLPTMKFNTAVSLGLLSASLWAASREWRQSNRLGRTVPWVARAAALGALVIGALSAFEAASCMPLGIDECLITDHYTRAAGGTGPGRMAGATATAVMALGAGLWLLLRVRQTPRSVTAARLLFGIAAMLGATAGAAWAISASGLSEVSFFSTMAVHTAWLLALLGLGSLSCSAGRAAAGELDRREPVRLSGLVTNAAVIIVVVGVLITLLFARREEAAVVAEAQARFDRLTERVVEEARRRIKLPVYGLNGARGVFVASTKVNRAEFRQYVESRDLPREFPGTVGIGFIECVQRADVDQFLADERADGAPDFKITTSGDHKELYVVKFIEPLRDNRAAWGFDVGSEPARREAVERAIRTGIPALTSRITLMQDPKHRPGFLLFVPVFKKQSAGDPLMGAGSSLVGLVYAPIMIDQALSGVAKAAEGRIDLEVFSERDAAGERLLYDDDGHLSSRAGDFSREAYSDRMFVSDSPVSIGGRTWILRTSTTPAFHAEVDDSKAILFALAGILLSTFGGALAWTLSRSHSRAVALAHSMTADLRKATAELERAALTDRLTGLPNRALLLDRIGHAIKRFQRDKHRPYAVLFLDFDRFKLINDTMGHDAGDQLLISIATRLRDQLRTTDSIALMSSGNTAARLGGDEFVVLLEDLTAPDDARLVASRLIEDIARPHDVCGQSVHSTASIGLVMGGIEYEDAADVLRDADVAMYEAKEAGKGRFVVFDESMRERVLRRVALEQDLFGAIDRGEFALVFQPVVRLDDGRIQHVEALLRWRHPTLGVLEPEEFIPVVEECGQHAALGDWVVREAASQAARFTRMFGANAAPIVSVNLFRRQLSLPDLPERLSAIVRSAGAASTDLWLEVTEAIIMGDANRATEQLRGLRNAGFGLVLDDFGTGQSALTYLHSLPLTALKLDSAFIAQAEQGRVHVAMVHAVVTLARNLGLLVVAEGIEREEQLAILVALDCTLGQGFHLGLPGSAEAIEARIRPTGHRHSHTDSIPVAPETVGFQLAIS